MTLFRFALPPLAAAALALSPAQARAEAELIGALLGATALYVIIDGISDDNKKHHGPPPPPPPSRHGHYHHHDVYPHHPAPGPAVRPHRPGGSGYAQVMPRRCVRTVETRHGPRVVAGEGCLGRYGVYRENQPRR